MSARRIALLVSYDGNAFCGWQVQDNARTVQGEIERALCSVHKADTRITGSGRTDSGVHALGQVAHFDTDSSVPAHKYRDALNSLLPAEIRVYESREVDAVFHSRFDATGREYEYRILPFTRRDAPDGKYWHGISRIPDVAMLNRMAAQIEGQHDFTTFSAAGDKNTSKTRIVRSAGFYMGQSMLIFRIHATAYLWKMVRSLVGTILDDEKNGCDADWFRRRLDAKEREMAGPTAPPQGLYLRRVFYDKSVF